MRAMLTGHRTVIPACLATMKRLIESLSDPTIISGGNLGTPTVPSGADRMWALAAFEVGAPYEIWVPAGYAEHYYGRNADMMRRFEKMCENADKVVFTSSLPFDWRHNFGRNVKMVKTADYYVVCGNKHPRSLLSDVRGGTAHCVKEMKRAGVKSVDWINSNNAEIHRGEWLVDASLF